MTTNKENTTAGQVIGERLKDRREKLGMSTKEAAAAAGWSVPYVVLIESGKGNPSINKVAEMANVLQTSMAKLVEKLGGSAPKHVAVPKAAKKAPKPKDEEPKAAKKAPKPKAAKKAPKPKDAEPKVSIDLDKLEAEMREQPCESPSEPPSTDPTAY